MTCHVGRRPKGVELTSEDLPKYGYMVCHYCGKRQPVPQKCPSCGSQAMHFAGYGTQTVEKELQTLFPEARLLRVDADTTGEKEAFERMLSDFREKEYDVMLGTQMVTKGHNFPSVTLVGIAMATPLPKLLAQKVQQRLPAPVYDICRNVGLLLVLLLCVLQVASNTYSAFIYFQF